MSLKMMLDGFEEVIKIKMCVVSLFWQEMKALLKLRRCILRQSLTLS